MKQIPNAIQHTPISENAQELVVCSDLMEVGSLLIGKEQVWLPDGVQHGGVQIKRVIGVFPISQAGVIPVLPQKDIDPIILKEPTEAVMGGAKVRAGRPVGS